MEQTKYVVNKLVPVGFRVLVDIPKKATVTSSGFILPETDNAGMPTVGMIVLTGNKTWWQKTLILLGLKPKYKVGQQVYFRKYSIDELKLNTPDGELTLYVLEEAEIIGLVETI